MNIKIVFRFIAWILDRVAIFCLFIAFMAIFFSQYKYSTYLQSYNYIGCGCVGTYFAGSVISSPSRYIYIDVGKCLEGIDVSFPSWYGDLDFIREKAAKTTDNHWRYDEQENAPIKNMVDVDKYCTTIFMIANILYLFVFSFFFKATAGEALLGFKTYDYSGDIGDLLLFFKRCISFVIVMGILIFFRKVCDLTYLGVTITYFIINGLLVCIKGVSIIDVLSRSLVSMEKP